MDKANFTAFSVLRFQVDGSNGRKMLAIITINAINEFVEHNAAPSTFRLLGGEILYGNFPLFR